MEQSIASDWYTRAFDALYPVIYAHRSLESAAREAQFAADCVRLRTVDAALDLCCGNGRHLFHLRQRTAQLCGLDYSADLLQLAAKTLWTLPEHDATREDCGAPPASDRSDKSDQSDRSDEIPAVGRLSRAVSTVSQQSDDSRSAKLLRAVRLVRADMRHIPFVNTFDVVFNFFTSFGYFNSQDDNLRVVRGVASALKDGGRFFIDYVNSAHVERNLVPESVRRAGSYDIHEHRWLDQTTQRVNKTIVVLKDKKRIVETGESVQLYTLEAFCELLSKGGLHVERVFGDYSGAPFDDEHPRMIVVGYKA